MDKPFALGILVGRFQTLHAGHQQMIETALSLCARVGIFVGSSQESGTRKNPFPYELRRKMLENLFGDRISIYPLPDIGVGNTAAWGAGLRQGGPAAGLVRQCGGGTDRGAVYPQNH